MLVTVNCLCNAYPNDENGRYEVLHLVRPFGVAQQQSAIGFCEYIQSLRLRLASVKVVRLYWKSSSSISAIL